MTELVWYKMFGRGKLCNIKVKNKRFFVESNYIIKIVSKYHYFMFSVEIKVDFLDILS